MRYYLYGLLFAVAGLSAATNIISDQLPGAASLDAYALGVRPQGFIDQAVRLVELATLPAQGQVQQIVGRGDSLFIVLKEGRVWEYDLQGTRAADPFLDVAGLRPDFNDTNDYGPSRGLRGFAFHPDYDTNGLLYTMHRENPDGSAPDYGTAYLDCEFVLAEWDFNQLTEGEPTFRQLFRIRMEHNWHTAQHLGFNPHAQPGDDEYGLLYACFGDNGGSSNGSPALGTVQLREESDISNVGQDFETIQAGVIRIDPLDPSGYTDVALIGTGRKRAENGNFSIPLDNAFIGHPTYREELYAKGFRNPLSMSFSPAGAPVIADVGEQTMEEINVLSSGGNYGWPVREGTFLVPWCDQVDGSPLGADDSMVWMPAGTVEEPAGTFYVRDKDQSNVRQETLARAGVFADGYSYPIFQFTHEGNNSNGTLTGTTAVIGGDYYTGFWAEELQGLYLFGNISTDQVFYGKSVALDMGASHSEIFELPFLDASGAQVALSALIGYSRVNMRFGKDIYGNLYLASKTNKKLYRLQGTPKLDLQRATEEFVTVGEHTYFEFELDRPPEDGTIEYTLEVSEDLSVGFSPASLESYELQSTTTLPDGRVRMRYRYLSPVSPGVSRFFKFTWDLSAL